MLDALWYRETEEPGSTKVTEKTLNNLKLSTLIDKAYHHKLIERSTYATSHILRGYRNLVHPANEEAKMLGPRPSQAVAAIDFLVMLIKNLSARK